MKTQIKLGKVTEQIEKKYYFFMCPECKIKIKGTSIPQAVVNLKKHYETSHPNKKFEKEVSLWLQ